MDPLILSVGEEDEVSIADAVNEIVKALDFKVGLFWRMQLDEPLGLERKL